jgi:hypothetical protein
VGAASFFTSHRGRAYASTALMDPMTKAFVADIHHFIGSAGVDLVHFGKERKDEVTQRYLADFTGTEGVPYARHREPRRSNGLIGDHAEAACPAEARGPFTPDRTLRDFVSPLSNFARRSPATPALTQSLSPGCPA